MEENNKTTNEENKLSYEQLAQVANTLQQRCIQAETKLSAINYTAIRLDYLFKVLNFKVLNREDLFPKDFTEHCVKEVIELLKIDEPEEEN